MAQIAIPMALLGGLYILANNDKNKYENFENENTDLQNRDYDLVQNEINRTQTNSNNENGVNDSDILNNAKPYLNANSHTDKYFFQNACNVVMQKDDKVSGEEYSFCNKDENVSLSLTPHPWVNDPPMKTILLNDSF